MARPTALRRALGTAGFALLAVALIFLAILPLDNHPGGLPGPDLLLAVTLVWVIHRPDLVPVWMIASAFLLADIIWMRPPGLTAAAMVMASEYIRRRDALTTHVHFAMEWSVAASMIACVMIGPAAIMVLLGTPAPGFGLLLAKLVATVLTYPVVMVAARLALGLGRFGAGGKLGFGSET